MGVADNEAFFTWGGELENELARGGVDVVVLHGKKAFVEVAVDLSVCRNIGLDEYFHTSIVNVLVGKNKICSFQVLGVSDGNGSVLF